MSKIHTEFNSLGESYMASSVACKQTITRCWLVAGLMLAAVSLLPSRAAALEPGKNTPVATSSNELLICETPVNQAVEVYGLQQLADAVIGYRRSKVSDQKRGEHTSFIVAGEVSNPGEYDLRSPVNLLAGILAAGGPSKDGSMRRIEVYQDGSLLGEFDLYSFFSDGRITGDFVFNGGEQVVVLPHGPQISITGNVARPAVFELKPEEMRLDQALTFAGGLPADDEIYRIEVVRVDAAKRQTSHSFDYQRGGAILPYHLEPGDQIHVLKCKKLLQALVYAQLPAQSRQAFGYKLDMRISDLLDILQPLPENIAVSYAEILREGRSDKKYEVISISINSLLRQITSGDSTNNLILRPGDILMLFDREFLEKKPVVGLEVKGQPLIFVDYKPGMKVSDLLAGSNIKLPHKRVKATVFRRQLNGSQLDVVSLAISIGAARRENQRYNIELQPFDTLKIEP